MASLPFWVSGCICESHTSKAECIDSIHSDKNNRTRLFLRHRKSKFIYFVLKVVSNKDFNSMKRQARASDRVRARKRITATKAPCLLRVMFSLRLIVRCRDATTQVSFGNFHEEVSTLVSLSDLRYPLAVLNNHL